MRDRWYGHFDFDFWFFVFKQNFLVTAGADSDIDTDTSKRRAAQRNTQNLLSKGRRELEQHFHLLICLLSFPSLSLSLSSLLFSSLA